MSLLRDQKELQRQYYKNLEAGDAGTENPKPVKTKTKNVSKGSAVSSRDVQKFNDLIAEDMLTYKGLPVEEKVAIKKKLIAKYKDHVEWVLSTAQKEDSLAVNGMAIWLFDTGDIKGFIETCDQATDIAQRQTVIPKKTYQLLKLYWIMDWGFEQRDLGLAYEPYFSQVFESVKDWKLPKKIKSSYWYLRFYTLLDRGKLKEAAEMGPIALKHGAEIKGNLAITEKIVAGRIKKKWDKDLRKFVNA